MRMRLAPQAGRFKMASACALAIVSGRIIYNFAFVATAFAERSVAMKAPVGLLSGRAVCVSRWRGFAPTSSAGRSKRCFHRRGCNQKWQMQTLPSSPSPSRLTPRHLSQRERPWHSGKVTGLKCKVCGFARGSPFGRAGALAPERASPLPPQRHAFAESGAANAVSLYDPSREKEIQKSPQAFLNPE